MAGGEPGTGGTGRAATAGPIPGSGLSGFPSVVRAFGPIPEPLPNPRSRISTPVFSSESFMVLTLLLKVVGSL